MSSVTCHSYLYPPSIRACVHGFRFAEDDSVDSVGGVEPELDSSFDLGMTFGDGACPPADVSLPTLWYFDGQPALLCLCVGDLFRTLV